MMVITANQMVDKVLESLGGAHQQLKFLRHHMKNQVKDSVKKTLDKMIVDTEKMVVKLSAMDVDK